jgi:hypothetical protein
MSRFITNPAEARAEAEVHTAWCACRDCKHVWDAAHCGLGRYAASALSILIAAIAIVAIIVVIA